MTVGDLAHECLDVAVIEVVFSFHSVLLSFKSGITASCLLYSPGDGTAPPFCPLVVVPSCNICGLFIWDCMAFPCFVLFRGGLLSSECVCACFALSFRGLSADHI